MKYLIMCIEAALGCVCLVASILLLLSLAGIIGGIFDPDASLLPSFYIAIKLVIYIVGALIALRLLKLLPKSIRPDD